LISGILRVQQWSSKMPRAKKPAVRAPTAAYERTTSEAPESVVIPPDDPHYHIPRGADGLPIFIILEPDVQQDFDAKMARCKLGWDADQHPGFVKEAQILVAVFHQTTPLWLSEAVIAVCERRQDEYKGKGPVGRAIQAAIRLMRYRAMLAVMPVGPASDVKTEQRVGWRHIRKYAAQNLAGGPAQGRARTMKADYERVKNDFKYGRGGLYLRPLPTFGRKLRDVLNGKHRPAGIKS
jgi:hypothetical protein